MKGRREERRMMRANRLATCWRRGGLLGVAVAAIALAACGPSKSDFVGRWKWKLPAAEFTIEFRDNDTYRIEGSGGLGYLVGLADAVAGVPCTEGAYEVGRGKLTLRCQSGTRVEEFGFRIVRASKGEALLERPASDGRKSRGIEVQLLRVSEGS